MVTGKRACNYYFPCIYVHTTKRKRLFLQFLNLAGLCDLLWPIEWGRSDIMPGTWVVLVPCLLFPEEGCQHHVLIVWSLCGQMCVHRPHGVKMSHPSWYNPRWHGGVGDPGQGTLRPKWLTVSVPWSQRSRVITILVYLSFPRTWEFLG